MAGFGTKKKSKQVIGKANTKKHKVQESNLKYNSKPKVEKKASTESVDNEIINLPVYCGTPDKNREIDLFISDSVIQSKKEIIKPYFIGSYSRKSFDMQIKSSTLESTPKDLVEDSSGNVVNLKRK